MVPSASAASAEAAAGVTRGALVAELAVLLGAPHEARFVVDEALGLGPFLGQPGVPTAPLDPAVIASARAMAGRRAAGEPLQYVFGHWPFRSLDLMVDPRVLIPRPETEQVVEVALVEARRLAGGRARWWSMPGPAPVPSHSRWRPNSAGWRGRRSGPSTPVAMRWRWRRPTSRGCGGAIPGWPPVSFSRAIGWAGCPPISAVASAWSWPTRPT